MGRAAGGPVERFDGKGWPSYKFSPPVPGVGPIKGCARTNGVTIAIRENNHGTPISYALIGGVWEEIKPTHPEPS